MNDFIKKLFNSLLFRYFIMAGIIVLIELGVFAFINSVLGLTYLIATPVSLAVAIVLNWYFSQKYIFKKSKHEKKIEFALVLVASLTGAVVQISITTISVELIGLIPIVGKLFAIIVTFFLNFWVRKRYIFST